MIALEIALLVLGLLLLWKTGEWSVENAVTFSRIYKIESFVVGFFIFALSTALPELTSAVVSSIKKVPDLSTGDLMGSAFANLSLLLGLFALIGKEIKIEPFLRRGLAQTLFQILFVMTVVLFFGRGTFYLGAFLILFYFLSVIFLPTAIMNHRQFEKQLIEPNEKKEGAKAKVFFSEKTDVVLKLLGSLILLIGSSWLTVCSAVFIAKMMEINISIFGGTVIAVGTSLPELALGIHAIKKREYGLILGDIFGASFLNVSLALGLLVLINTNLSLVFSRQVFPFLLAISLFLFLRLIWKQRLSRVDGLILVITFFIYVVATTWSPLNY